jgi:ribosomal 50S subunit-recycling heat shock protein
VVVVTIEVVVDELASGMVDEVEAGEEVVVEVGRIDVSGRIVSPGAIVATGFVVVVSPEAERFVVPLAHAANRRPQASVTAID